MLIIWINVAPIFIFLVDLNQSYGNWGLLSNIQIITHFPSRKVLHFYLVIMTTSMGWGVILIFCSCNKLNCSKKEIFSCDYTMAGVQTEKLALQTQHHRHLHKTLPSLTCTFCILVYDFAPTNYSLT